MGEKRHHHLPPIPGSATEFVELAAGLMAMQTARMFNDDDDAAVMQSSC